MAFAPPAAGDPAPDYALPDHHGVTTSLAPGQPTLIVFIPAAFTPVCHEELLALRDLAERLRIAAISCDSMFVLRELADREDIGFSLLSDFWPHGDVARRYGAFNEEMGMPVRASFLVDGDAVVQATWRSSPDRARDPDDYVRAWNALDPDRP